MPLRSGTSRKVISENIKEFTGGKTFQKTKKKFGADKARRQAIAASLSKARQSGAKIPKKSGY